MTKLSNVAMTKEQLLISLSKEVGCRIGNEIALEDIHTDRDGWYNYIPANKVKRYNPLVLRHYQKNLFMIIPTADWNDLLEQKITVLEYIDNATWNFGYYWGGVSILNGIYWQHFEEKGIKEKDKIEKYLSILYCRSNQVLSGYMPMREWCKRCKNTKCPFEAMTFKTKSLAWNNEFPEEDKRKELYKIIRQRIKELYGFEVLYLESGPEDAVVLHSCCERNTVSVMVSENVLLDLLFSPNKCNIEKISKELPIRASNPQIDGKEQRALNGSIPILENATAEFFYNFWAKDYNVKKWVPIQEVNAEKEGFWNILFKWYSNLLNLFLK